MHTELRNEWLHVYPATIAEFKDLLFWRELNHLSYIQVHRPLEQLAEYKQLLLNNDITVESK
jgi:hypothetical protein